MELKVAIAGITGAVGQEFLALLEQRSFPATEYKFLASSRSAGKKINFAGKEYTVEELSESSFEDMDIALFSAGGSISKYFAPIAAKNGCTVVDNSSAFRMEDDVPLVIPEINSQAIHQHKGIISNPNCSTTHLVCALKPIYDAFGLAAVNVVTMQAISGAGYPGVPSLDILDNVIPYIGGEEEKLELEPLKLLGKLSGEAIAPAEFVLSAQANRVAVLDGHLEAVSIKLKQPASLDQLKAVLQSYQSEPQRLGLPSAPAPAIIVHSAPDRPQPRLDRMAGNGMATHVGRLRSDPILDYKFLVLGHNTIRGAAGGAILNAELLLAKGYLGG